MSKPIWASKADDVNPNETGVWRVDEDGTGCSTYIAETTDNSEFLDIWMRSNDEEPVVFYYAGELGKYFEMMVEDELTMVSRRGE